MISVLYPSVVSSLRYFRQLARFVAALGLLPFSAATSVERQSVVLQEFVDADDPIGDRLATSLLGLESEDRLYARFGGSQEGAPDVRVCLCRKLKEILN